MCGAVHATNVLYTQPHAYALQRPRRYYLSFQVLAPGIAAAAAAFTVVAAAGLPSDDPGNAATASLRPGLVSLSCGTLQLPGLQGSSCYCSPIGQHVPDSICATITLHITPSHGFGGNCLHQQHNCKNKTDHLAATAGGDMILPQNCRANHQLLLLSQHPMTYVTCQA